MSTLQLGLLYGGATFVVLFSGMPIAFAVGGVALAFMLAFMPAVNVAIMAETIYSELDNFVLLTIPLFVLMGAAVGKSRAGADLYSSLNRWLGRVPGGLGMANVLACSLFAAMCGSSPATCSAIGSVGIPEMRKRGYPDGIAAGSIAAGGTLGILIPPSVTMIVYGWVTDTSILACFLATLGPGLLIMVSFSVVNLFMARKFPLVLDDKPTFSELSGEVARRGFHAFPALLMPVIILGGIYGGVMTPTEAAAVSVIYAVPVGFLIYKGLKLENFLSAGREAATAVGAIMMMILFSMILSQMFVYESIPQQLVQGIFTITENKVLLLILINILLFLVGMVVNDVTAIILIAPLLLPLMNAIGVSPVQFAAIMGVNTAMGGVTPPYASILYLGARIGKVKVTKVIPPAMKLILLGYVPVVFLTSLWPDLSLFLPRFFGYDVAP